jgi:hypothetical protein
MQPQASTAMLVSAASVTQRRDVFTAHRLRRNSGAGRAGPDLAGPEIDHAKAATCSV